MVWEAAMGNAKKAAAFNHWPTPTNWLTDIKILMCNQDTWMAQFEFAAAAAAYLFYTQFIPGPRELERKALTGGYRCGFYLNVKVKSPIEIIWGRGTATMIGEIARPFVTPLFYYWAMGVGIEALAIWQSMMFPQAACDVPIGDVLLENARTTIPPGHTEGIPGLGELKYDHLNINSPTQPDATIPAGSMRCTARWIFNAGPTGMFNIGTAFFVDSNVVDHRSHGDLGPGQQLYIEREFSRNDGSGHEVGAWMEADGGPSVVSGAAICMIWVVDVNESDDPPDWPSNLRNHPELPIPSNCHMDGVGPS